MKIPRQRGRARAGFTLVELLITLALMIIMYVALYGSFARSHQEKMKIVCRKNLQAVHLALQLYAADHRDAYPFIRDATTAEPPLSLLVPRYTAATDIFICPGTKTRPPPQAPGFGGRPISYAYYLGHGRNDGSETVLMSDRQVDTAAKVAAQLVFSPDGKPPGDNHKNYGGNLLSADGRVEESPPHASRDLPCPPGITLLNPKP
ncbi:type II secretion system protein [bacterium]|nr:type II secretion system protein [bacterium]